MSLWRWLQNRAGFSPAPVKIVVRHRSATTLRIGEWRADRELCALAGKLFADPNLQLMLQVAENDHPGFNVLRDDTPLDMRAMYQARTEGYTMALANLRSLARLSEPALPLEEDYLPEENAT